MHPAMHNGIQSRTRVRILLKSVAMVMAASGLVEALAETSATPAEELPGNLIGMYIHQHWPYNYPYAARTWQVEDYHGYCGGLKALGYN